MQTMQERLTSWLRENRTIYVCDGCLALKMGALPREVQDALAAIGRRGDRVQLATGQCSECLRTMPVVRTLAA
jgi:hypothetical protein